MVFLPPLAAFAALGALAGGSPDPVDPMGQAEVRHLAVLAAGVLLAVAALEGATPRARSAPSRAASSWGTVLASLGVVAAAWLLPVGPVRSAGVLAVLAMALTVTGARALLAARLVRPSPGLGALSPRVTVPVAIGLQLVVRSGELTLLQAGWRAVALAGVVYVALPAVGALAVSWLARQQGPVRALAAAGAALTLAPGFNPAVVVALLALGLVPVVIAPLRSGDRFPETGGNDRSVPLWQRVVAAALVLAPALWNLEVTTLALLCGLALALAPRPVGPDPDSTLGVSPRDLTGPAWVLVPAILGVALRGVQVLVGGEPPTVEAMARAGALPFLLVPLVVAALALRDRSPGEPLHRPALAARWIAAVVLALAAAGLGTRGALAAPVALAACAFLPGGLGRPRPRESGLPEESGFPEATLQALWGGALLVGTGLAAALPWVRPRALETALGWLGLSLSSPGAAWLSAAAVVVGLGLAALALRAGRGPLLRRISPPLAATAVFLGLVAPLVGAGAALGTSPFGTRAAPLLEGPLTLGGGPGGPATHPWSHRLPRPVTASGIAVESSLANAAELPAGTPVATLEISGPGGTVRRLLRIGEHTGEWAARRPDLVAAGTPAPAPSVAWVAAGGQFLGQRYRARLPFDPPIEPMEVEEIRLRPRPDLPEAVELTVFRLDLLLAPEHRP